MQYVDGPSYGRNTQLDYGEERSGRGGGRGRGRGGGGGGRGRGGGGGGGRGGYDRRPQQQQRGGHDGEAFEGPAGYQRRGPVSYDDDNDMRSSGGEPGEGRRGGRGGGRGNNGGGRGGGRGRGGGGPRERRGPLSPEATAVNESIFNAKSWRELQAVLEQQSRPGMPGLDPFQLVAMLLQLAQLPELPKDGDGDDAADFLQFISSGAAWLGLVWCGLVFRCGLTVTDV